MGRRKNFADVSVTVLCSREHAAPARSAENGDNSASCAALLSLLGHSPRAFGMPLPKSELVRGCIDRLKQIEGRLDVGLAP